MPKLRIAFISAMSGEPWGGSELLWSQTAAILHQLGHEICVSVQGWPTTPKPVQELRKCGVEVRERHKPSPSRLNRIKGKILLSLFNDSNPNLEWAYVRDFSPHLVCISQGGIACGLEWMELCQQDFIPYVLITHANSHDMWPVDALSRRLRKGYLRSHQNFFVSNSNKRLLQHQLGAILTNTQIVRSPFAVQYDEPLSWPPEMPIWRLACVGRLAPKAKGQDLIIEVLSDKIWKNRNIQISLYGNGPYLECLESLIKLYKLSDVVTICGHCDEVSYIWRTHHALILPSRYEGLPLAVVEAMICHRIPIVTDVAGNTEIVQDGLTGFIAPAPTVSHLQETLERAWAQRSEWKSMGQAAGTAIRTKVPPNPAEKFAESLLNLFTDRLIQS